MGVQEVHSGSSIVCYRVYVYVERWGATGIQEFSQESLAKDRGNNHKDLN